MSMQSLLKPSVVDVCRLMAKLRQATLFQIAPRLRLLLEADVAAMDGIMRRLGQCALIVVETEGEEVEIVALP